MKYNDLQTKILTEFTGILFSGLKASYKPAADHLDKLYFATDTHELLVNGTSYSGGVSAVSIEGTTLKITMVDGSSKTVDLAEILKYKSALADDIATVNALGGIPAGTTVAQLKNKTFSQLLMNLYFLLLILHLRILLLFKFEEYFYNSRSWYYRCFCSCWCKF